MEQTSRRSKRTRVAVDYARLDSTGFSDCIRVQHKRLARAVLKFEGQPSVDNYCVDYVGANELRDHVHTTGFRNPSVVRASDVSPSALGIRLPEEELTVERIADLVGRNRQIDTIDVVTQSEGPMYTMQEWVEYFAASSPRKPLLNVVSLVLDNTSLQEMVSAPTLVKELDLVEKAWPASVSPSPKASVFFADRASGSQKIELSAGDTLLLPGGWPHCVVTPVDSLVIGGNFLAGYNLSLQLDIWQMEERLKIRSKFRFPFYKELMWHTASTYLGLLKEDSGRDVWKVTKWERDGMHSLTRWLRLWLGQMKDGNDVPKEIPQPGNLLVEDLVKYSKATKTLQNNVPEARSCVSQTDYANRNSDGTDQNFDLAKEMEVHDDEQFLMESSKITRNHTTSKKLTTRTSVDFSGTKTVTSSAPQSAASSLGEGQLSKSENDVRQQLFHKCGFTLSEI